jgi:hypothetical protein
MRNSDIIQIFFLRVQRYASNTQQWLNFVLIDAVVVVVIVVVVVAVVDDVAVAVVVRTGVPGKKC